MVRKLLMPAALAVATFGILAPTTASAQWYNSGPHSSVQFSWGWSSPSYGYGGGPYSGYYSNPYYGDDRGGYYDDRRAAWRAHERWERHEAHRRYWERDRWEHHRHHDDDDDGDYGG